MNGEKITPRGRVLIVEHEDNLRESLSFLLREEGYTVGAASSAEVAVQALDGEPYDVVLLDLDLANMQGMTVFRAVQNRQTETQLIVITAFRSVQHAIEAVKHGAFGYIKKPFHAIELLDSLERARHESARRRAAQSRRNGGTSSDVLAATVDQRWTMERLEREYILRVLDETGGHRGRAAEILGIDRRTLYRKLKEYAHGRSLAGARE